MIGTALTAAALALSSLALPTMADSTSAYCMLMWDDTSKDTIKAPRTFSQYGSIAYVDDFNFYKFAFPAAEEGKTPISATTKKRESLSSAKVSTPWACSGLSHNLSPAVIDRQNCPLGQLQHPAYPTSFQPTSDGSKSAYE